MLKTKIEKLKEAAKTRFDGATTPEAVKAATEELAALDELEKETGELETQNASLLASYKEIVKREPVSKKPATDPEDEDESGKGLEFAEALDQILAARTKKGE